MKKNRKYSLSRLDIQIKNKKRRENGKEEMRIRKGLVQVYLTHRSRKFFFFHLSLSLLF